MSTDPNPILVTQTRGPRVETLHRGAHAVADLDGHLRVVGDAETPAFLRSGAKFFQALPGVMAGTPERFGLDERALALMCASHNAEEEHVEVAQALLAAGGLVEDDLICGPHPPMHPETAARMSAAGFEPSRIHNNCSGKHAGMMLACIARGEPHGAYADPHHPLQLEIRRLIRELSGAADEKIELAVDGCGAPTWIMPLAAVARAFARYGRPDPTLSEDVAGAARRLADAVAAHPQMIAGTGRLCSAVARATGGRILIKVGADGFYGGMVRDRGVGIALHLDDGSTFVTERLMVAILAEGGLLDEREQAELAPWFDPIRRNCAGEPIGEIEIHLAGI